MKKLTVNQSLEIALHNRIAAIKSLEASNERLREMVLRHVTIGAVLQEDLNLLHNCEQGHCNHYMAHDDPT